MKKQKNDERIIIKRKGSLWESMDHNPKKTKMEPYNNNPVIISEKQKEREMIEINYVCKPWADWAEKQSRDSCN